MAHYTPPAIVGPSKVALWEPTLGRTDFGNLPFTVESFQIGSPDIRDNIKNRALIDGVFDDTQYHGASTISITFRLAAGLKCNAKVADYYMATLRDTIASYMHPRLRPRLYWRYPGDPGPIPGASMGASDGFGQWAEVRGASWPFVVAGPKYPRMVAQFKNPLGQMYLGDPEAAPFSATAYPGAEAAGRTYDLSFDRDYPNVDVPVGTAVIHNDGNSYAGFTIQVHGPFDAGATLVLNGVSIDFNAAIPVNEYVEFKSLNKTVRRDNGNSYYPNTNFGEWTWEDLLLPHGDSFMNFEGLSGGLPSGWATIEWYSTSI